MTGATICDIEHLGDHVKGMTFSSDSSLLALTYFGGNIKILNVKTGHVELVSTQTSRAISFLPGGHLIMSLSRDGKMSYWEKEGSVYLETFYLTTFGWSNVLGRDTLNSATFSTCAKLLAVQRPSHCVEVYDLRDRTKLTLNLTLAHGIPSCDLLFSTDSRLLASVSRDYSVLTIWDLETGTEKLSMRFRDSILNVAFSPESRIIATGTFGTIQLWDIETGNCKASLQDTSGHAPTTDALAFSPNGLLLASAVNLWDMTLRQDSNVSYRHSLNIRTVIWSPNGRLIASGSNDKTIQIWDAGTGIRRWILKGHEGSIDELLFSSDSNLLASASDDRTLRIWCMNSGVLRNTVMDEWGSISEVAYSRDGEMAASISSSPRWEIKLWRAKTGKQLRTLESPRTTIEKKDGFNSITFSPDGRIIAVATMAGPLICWATATGEKIQEIRPGHTIHAIKFSPDGQLIAVANGLDESIWRVRSSPHLHTFDFTGLNVFDLTSLAFSFDGKLSVLDNKGSGLCIWDVSTGTKRYELEGHEGYSVVASFSPDDQMIAVASSYNHIRIWKFASQSRPHLTLWHDTIPESLDFSPDGRALVAATRRDVILLWDTSSGSKIMRISHPEGLIKHIDFLADEIAVSTLYPASPRFWNVWNDMNLRVQRYSLAAITPEDGLEHNVGKLRLENNESWISKGSERLLWIPPQYRPESQRQWASKGSNIFIGSISGHVVRFRTS